MQRVATCFWMVNGFAIAYLATIPSVKAQIIPDTTLPINTRVTEQGNRTLIEGGTQAGSNLFHSFKEFSIPTGREGFFNNAVDIRNIFSRVTGNSISDIDGLIKANGTANLFLINPNGIIFGPNARLNIGGSFLASTASAIGFGDGGFFSARVPNDPSPLLTVNPNSLLFNQIAAQPIVNQALLRVRNGQSLLLVGGNVNVDGGLLLAFGGRVELGGLAGTGTLGLSVNANNLSLSFPQGVQKGDVSMSAKAIIDVRDTDAGTIAVNAQNFTMEGESIVQAGIENNLGSPQSKAGDIEINTTGVINLKDRSSITNNVQPGAVGHAGNIIINTIGVVNLKNGSSITNNVESGAVGDGGNIIITTRSLFALDGAQLSSSTFGKGNAGSVIIRATDTISFDGGIDDVRSAAFSSAQEGSEGKGGSVDILARSLKLTNGGQISASTFGQGDAGSVTIRVTDTISFDGTSGEFFSGISSTGEPGSLGNGGKIDISTESLTVSNNALIVTSTRGNKGNAGDITISTGSLSVTSGAELQSVTYGQGNAGSLTIVARDSVFLDGVNNNQGFSSGLLSGTNDKANGQGGDIKVSTPVLRLSNGAVLSARTRNGFRGGDIIVNTNKLEITDGAQILTTAFSSGQAGNITINTTDSITISGSDPTFEARLAKFGGSKVDPVSAASGIFANTDTKSEGGGGNIGITTGQLLIRDGGQVSVSSEGSGSAGKLEIIASSVLLDRGKLSAEIAFGKGGNIDLKVTNRLLMQNESLISARAFNQANGGNINIGSTFIIAMPSTGADGSDIIASASKGNGGKVDITTLGLFGIESRLNATSNNDITVSSEFGLDGTFEFNSPEVDPSQGLINLPSQVIDASNQIAQNCPPRGSRQENRFVITGTGGIPPRPGDPMDSPFSTGEVRTLPEKEGRQGSNFTERSQQNFSQYSISSEPNNPVRLVEATGWVRGANGEVILTTQATNDTPDRYWSQPTNCQNYVN